MARGPTDPSFIPVQRRVCDAGAKCSGDGPHCMVAVPVVSCATAVCRVGGSPVVEEMEDEMAVPPFKKVMRSVLQVLADAGECEMSLQTTRDRVATHLELSSEDLRQRIPSGAQSTLYNRVGWGISYMYKAGLIERTRRAHIKISPDGMRVNREHPGELDHRSLQKFGKFAEWRESIIAHSQNDRGDSSVSVEEEVEEEEDDRLSPEEMLERGSKDCRDLLEREVLGYLMSAESEALDRAIRDLMTAMGYGGAERHVDLALVGGNSCGLDAMIWEDALGLDRIYLQVRRYPEDREVSEGEMNSFLADLDAKGQGVVKKGVLATTTRFSPDAVKRAKESSKKIALIDGGELARLMVRRNIGVRVERTYELKVLDDAYFEDE